LRNLRQSTLRRLCLEVHDLSRLGERKIVMGRLRHRPQHARVAVELEESEQLPDDQDVAVREQQSVAPEVPAMLLRALGPRVTGKYPLELRTPFVKDLTVHIHQQGHGAMARGDQVQPGRDALGVVLGDALRITRLLGTCEIADGAQLLDQLGLARRSGGRARRWGSRLTIPSVPITVDATTKPARKRAEEEGEEPARSV
jgi:hypothetical protein